MTPLVVIRFETENEDIKNLCKQYWEVNDKNVFAYTFFRLCRDHNITYRQLIKLVMQHCDAVSSVIACAECKKPYVFANRSDFKYRIKHKEALRCEECKLKEEKRKEAKRIEAERQFHGIIMERYGSVRRSAIDPRKLSFEHAVSLLSFIRLYATADLSFARSMESVEGLLSPTTAMDSDIVKQLIKENLISVHPNSPVTAFEGENVEQFYIRRALWNLPFGLTSENSKYFARELETIFIKNDWPHGWRESRFAFCKKVALNECLQYLAVSLHEYGLKLNPGEKTLMVIDYLLEDYSVAQIINLIWRSSRDAAAFQIREHKTRKHAANCVVGSLQRYGERFKAEKWDLKPYGRPRKCPQSMVSHVLFHVALKIGDDGFYKAPRLME